MKNRLSAVLYRLAGLRGRVALVLTLVFAGVVLGATPASADPGAVAGTTCATAPGVQSPTDGVSASLMPPRDTTQPTGAQATMFEKYGMAGLNFEEYDLGIDSPTGCLPNSDSMNASISDWLANLLMTTATGLAALADSILKSTYDTSWMGTLDPFITSAIHRLQTNIFNEWATVAFAVMGFLLIWRARKASLSGMASLIGGGMVVFVLATALFQWPTEAGHAYDGTVTGVTQRVGDAINGDSSLSDPNAPKRTGDQTMMNALYEGVFYRTWLAGTFGDPDSVTAKTYGPRLFAAHALSWDEATSIAKAQEAAAKDPEYGKNKDLNPFGGMMPKGFCKKPGEGSGILPGAPVVDPVPCSAVPMYQKQADFQKVAAEIKKADPGAYTYLQGGAHGQDRVGYAFLALLAVLLSLPIIVIGGVAMALCFLTFRFLLIFAPIVAPVGMVQTNLAMNLFDRAASIAVTAFVWGIGIPIVMTLNSAVFTSGLNPVIRLVLLAVIFVGSILTLFGLAPGFSGVFKRKHAKRGWRMVQKGLGWLIGGEIAGRAAKAAMSSRSNDSDDDTGSSTPAPAVAAPAASTAETPAQAEIVPDTEDFDDDIIDAEVVDPAPEVAGRIPAERALPTAPVEGEVVDRGELPPATAGDLPTSGAKASVEDPASRAREARPVSGAEDVYDITDPDVDWKRDPADFGDDDDVHGGVPALPAGGDES